VAVLLLAAAIVLAPNWEAPLVVVKFKNDLERPAEIGLCKNYPRCTNTHRSFTDRIAPGHTLQENASADDLMNNFLATDAGNGRLLGCAYLRWRQPPKAEPFVLLSRLVHC
jgi:hypothetical protein